MIRINLLQPDKKELKEVPDARAKEAKPEKRREIPVSRLIILLVLGVIAVTFILQSNAIKKERNLLRRANEEKQKLQDVLSKLEKLELQKDLYERRIVLIQQLKLQQPVAVIIMDEMSKHIPEWVWLTSSSYKANALTIDGKAISFETIGDYIANLQDSRFFNMVNLVKSNQRIERANRYYEFTLTASYVPPFQPKPPPPPPPKTKVKRRRR